MRKSAISACVAFLATANVCFAQEAEKQDTFSQAVDDHIEGEIKDKIRENLTKRLLDMIGDQSLSDLAKKIPGVLAKRNTYAILADGIRMATTIAPVGEGSDIVSPIEPSSLRQILVDNIITEECGGRGKIDPRAVHVSDLTIDGFEDFIVDISGISCDPSASEFRPVNCGAQVCLSYFYVFENTTFKRVWEQLAYVEEITSNVPPNVVLYLHGGERVRVSWNGETFSDR